MQFAFTLFQLLSVNAFNSTMRTPAYDGAVKAGLAQPYSYFETSDEANSYFETAVGGNKADQTANTEILAVSTSATPTLSTANTEEPANFDASEFPPMTAPESSLSLRQNHLYIGLGHNGISAGYECGSPGKHVLGKWFKHCPPCSTSNKPCPTVCLTTKTIEETESCPLIEEVEETVYVPLTYTTAVVSVTETPLVRTNTLYEYPVNTRTVVETYTR